MANKPSYLTGGSGAGGSLSAKRGTEDLDFFIGDEALVAASGPGAACAGCGKLGTLEVLMRIYRIWDPLSSTAWSSGELGKSLPRGREATVPWETIVLTLTGSYGTVLVEFNI